jgi:hypothetical protein
VNNDPVVDRVVSAYLDAIDLEAPGLIEGLYLTGSAALGDFRPHTSDIDFVAVTPVPPDVSALERVHARWRRRPYFDGLYVTWSDLARDSTLAHSLPLSYEGHFSADKGVGDPVTWHTIAQHGVVCRGPNRADVEIWTDPKGLAAWTLDNLESYWRPLLDSWSLVPLTSWGTVWIVLGIPRLHYTLATGGICSKEAAGVYALQVFPAEWHGIINEALRIRRADRARPDLTSALTDLWRPDTLLRRRRDVLAFGSMVIDDARRRYPNS